MTTAVNTPHTITNGLRICFSSETDIPSDSPTTPVLGATGVVALMRVRCVRGSGLDTCASVLNATKTDRTIVLECNGRDCTNSMVRCGASSPQTAKNQHALPEIFPSPRGWPTALCSDRIRVASVSTNGLGIDGIERRHGRISRACGVLKAPRCFSVQERHQRPGDNGKRYDAA